MSYGSALNPDVVKTELDDVFMQTFTPERKPGHADITDGSIFIQDSTDKAAEQQEVFKGVSLWDSRGEEENVASDSPLISDKITFNVVNFAKSIDIPKNFFDDNMHGSYTKMVVDFARKGRITQVDNGFSIYRGAFTTTLTADGATLISDAHTTISGATVDNKITAVLSPTSLNTLITMLAEQKDQAGVVMGHVPSVLLVPPALFKTAVEITKSTLLANTTDNNINWVSSEYGIMVKQSERLGAAAGGSDTAYFLLGDNHSVNRWVRQGIVTDLVDYKYSRNNNYVYKGEFREVVGAVDYSGICGSTGLG